MTARPSGTAICASSRCREPLSSLRRRTAPLCLCRRGGGEESFQRSEHIGFGQDGPGLGVALGVLSAVKKGTKIDGVLTAGALFIYSMPGFWMAVMLVLVFMPLGKV